MFDEQTPDIQEPEYQPEDGRETFLASGEESTEQVVASWFQDDPTEGPLEFVPHEGYTPDPATTDPAVTDVNDPSLADPSLADPSLTDPSFSDQSVTHPSPSDPSLSDQSATGPSFNDQSATDPSLSDPSLTDPSQMSVTDPAPAVPTALTSDQPATTDPSSLQTTDDPSLVQQVPTFHDQDLTSWTDTSTPQDWTAWSCPTDCGPDTWTDQGYSTDWGQVQADAPQEGQDLWTQSPTQTPLSDDVLGPGHQDDQYWGNQGQTNYCVLYSAASILGEVYGHPIDMNEMVQRADSNGWLVHDSSGTVLGVNPQNFDDLLASYGVPSHNIDNEGQQAALEDLNTALTNNQRVIVSLDSKEIDAKQNLGTDNDADHAVAVTGIDYAKGVVIVNDSARSAGLEIPLDVFMGAWNDSGYHLTVTDNALQPGSGAVPPTGSDGPLPDAPEFAVMPFTLHLPTDAPTLPEPKLS